MQITSGLAKRPRGRPARLHRDDIVKAVAELLRADPTAPFTMARAAEAVDAAPMSLYRHFRDRDELVGAVLQHVLGDVLADVRPTAPWQERVRAWMAAVYARAVEYPQLFRAAAAADSVAWLPSSATLAAILADAGFRGERAIAEGVYWISTAALGHAMIAASQGTRLAVPRLYGGLGALDPDVAARAARLIPHFAAIGAAGFDLVIELSIGALERRLANRSAAKR
jgi:AcrR family transcriptional regulator